MCPAAGRLTPRNLLGIAPSCSAQALRAKGDFALNELAVLPNKADASSYPAREAHTCVA